jgi:hypothetical protein
MKEELLNNWKKQVRYNLSLYDHSDCFAWGVSAVIQRILLELQAINEDLGAGQRYDAQAKVQRLIESLTKQGER